MANFFDQFDAPATQGAASNFFDQFDSPQATDSNQPASQNQPQQKPFSILDTWPVKLAEGLWQAAKYPGEVYAGNEVVPSSANGGENIDKVTNLAGIAPVSQVVPAMRAVPPVLSSIRSAAKSLYRRANNLKFELKPGALGDFGSGLQAALNQEGWNDVTAPKTMGLINKLQSSPEGSFVTPQNIHSAQKSFGMVRDSVNNDAADRAAAGIALNHFNNFLENLGQNDLRAGSPDMAQNYVSLIKEANGNYTSYKLGNSLEQRIYNAQNNAASAHSGANVENALRTQFRQIINNPKLQRGYTPEQLSAMQQFVRGSGLENITRAGGNLLGGGGGLGMIAAGSIGHLMGLPPEALPMVGLALKQFGNNRALSEANQIAEMIRAASPLARSGAKSLVARSPLAVGAAASGARLLPQYTTPPNFQLLSNVAPYFAP